MKRRFLETFGANIYGQIVVAAVQIVGVPILLHAWGVQLYGEWLILFAIPSYLTFSDLGFSQSAANDMSARAARGDQSGAIEVFQSLLVLVSVVVVVGIVIVSGVLPFLPLNHWLHFTVLDQAEVQWVLWLLAAEVLIRLIDGNSQAGFRASGEYGLWTLVYFTTMLTQYIGVWCVALLGYGPVTAAAAYLLVRIVSDVINGFLLIRRHPWLRYGVRHARLAELRRLFRPAVANVSLPIAQAVNIQGMVLVVGIVLGPIPVVVFATLRTLTRFALQGGSTVNNSLEPELAFAWGRQDKPLLRKLYTFGLAGSFWIALSAAVALYFLGAWILAFWTHHKVMMDAALFDWLLLTSVVGAIWYGGLILRRATNRHLGAAFWYMMASVASVVLAGVLLKFTGRLADAGLALLLTDVPIAVYILTTNRRLVDMSPVRALLQMINLRAVLRPVFVGMSRGH